MRPREHKQASVLGGAEVSNVERLCLVLSGRDNNIMPFYRAQAATSVCLTDLSGGEKMHDARLN